MSRIAAFIVAILFISFIYFMGKYMTAERACFVDSRVQLEDMEIRYKTQNYPQELYCKLTYATLDTLDQCMTKANSILPSNMKFIEKFIDDLETTIQ